VIILSLKVNRIHDHQSRRQTPCRLVPSRLVTYHRSLARVIDFSIGSRCSSYIATCMYINTYNYIACMEWKIKAGHTAELHELHGRSTHCQLMRGRILLVTTSSLQ